MLRRDEESVKGHVAFATYAQVFLSAVASPSPSGPTQGWFILNVTQ